MKIRNGFVSNSSSSSFVIIGTSIGYKELLQKFGWKEDGDNFDEKGKLYEEDYDFFENVLNKSGLFYDHEGGAFGHVIAQGDDSDFSGDEITIREIIKIAVKVSKLLNVPSDDVKIFSGVMAC